MENRITPENITELKENEIFCFGSNLSGRHGKGAAKTAMQWGAVYGQARGLQGQTYGIPTVNKTITDRLPLDKIQWYVDEFVILAHNTPELIFLVSKVGCGLAGWTVKDIAPLFKTASTIDNIYLPIEFWKILCDHSFIGKYDQYCGGFRYIDRLCTKCGYWEQDLWY